MKYVISSLAAIVLLTGCGGGGPSSPTSPSPRYSLQGNVFIQNRSFQPTLQEIEIFFDGRSVGTVTDSNGTGQLNAVITDLDVAPGQHRIAVKIVEHLVARATYWTPGSHVLVIDSQTGQRVMEEFLANQSASLREGQGFDWEVTF